METTQVRAPAVPRRWTIRKRKGLWEVVPPCGLQSHKLVTAPGLGFTLVLAALNVVPGTRITVEHAQVCGYVEAWAHGTTTEHGCGQSCG
jgi:hypothetical protein